MYPWMFYWAPHLNLPGSGSVNQRIEPNTSWFFGAIPPSAGDGRIEQKAFEVASYGRQLGLITEVLLDIAEKAAPASPEGQAALRRLTEVQARIAAVKEMDASAVLADIEALVTRLKQRAGASYPQLRERIEQALRDPAV